MRLTLDALSTVAAIVREGSINRAAETLHRAPSTVWYTVKKLERDLGLKIMTRQGRGVVLTAEGQELLNRGGLVLDLVGDLERSLKRIASGWEATLRIAAGDVVPNDWLIELLAELQLVSPTTTFSVSREVLAGGWDSIITRRADVVIGAPSAPPEGHDLVGMEFGTVEFITVVAPEHPLASAAEPLTPDVMTPHRVVVVSDTSRTITSTTVQVFPDQPMLHVPDLDAKRIAQLKGLGVGSLPRYLVQADIDTGRLVHKVFAGDPVFEPEWIGWRAESSGKALEWLRNRVEHLKADWLTDARGGM